jgi:hypothetical protein
VGLDRDSPQPRVTSLGQQQTPPRGRLQGHHVAREGDVLQSNDSESGPPWESAGPPNIRSGPLGWSRTPRVRIRPLEWDSDPSHMGSGLPTVGSQDLT